mgnify:CR=1 FL=1
MKKPSKITPRYVGLEHAGRVEKLSREEIRDRFGRETASAYSQRDLIWMPEFRQMIGMIPELLRSRLPAHAIILDLGAGTGNLSRTVLEALPEVKIALMDFSENMLSEVPNVLTDFPGRYEILRDDFIEADFGVERYAAVISSFAIHHCRGEAEYSRLYGRLFKALQPGGIFVCCDVVAGADEVLTQLNEDGWRSLLRNENLSEKDIERILANYHIEDSPLDLGSHLRLLKEAGFSIVDVVWKRINFAVYTAIRAQEIGL